MCHGIHSLADDKVDIYGLNGYDRAHGATSNSWSYDLLSISTSCFCLSEGPTF